MIAGVPAGLYDAVDGIVKTASSSVETYEALKTLFNSGDLLGNDYRAHLTSLMTGSANVNASRDKIHSSWTGR